MKYRSRQEIMASMLEAATGGSGKTKIMYAVYLSYGQLKEYLSLLLENGLIRYGRSENEYTTTEKGLEFLKMSLQIGDMVRVTKIDSANREAPQKQLRNSLDKISDPLELVKL